MKTDFTRQRLFNKAHIFISDDALCSRCGANVTEALNTPFRCTGQMQTPPKTKRPTTLTAALNNAEDHIAARQVAVDRGAELHPWSDDSGSFVPTLK